MERLGDLGLVSPICQSGTLFFIFYFSFKFPVIFLHLVIYFSLKVHIPPRLLSPFPLMLICACFDWRPNSFCFYSTRPICVNTPIRLRRSPSLGSRASMTPLRISSRSYGTFRLGKNKFGRFGNYYALPPVLTCFWISFHVHSLFESPSLWFIFSFFSHQPLEAWSLGPTWPWVFFLCVCVHVCASLVSCLNRK